ncbi:MAG: S1 RNA-binding domain-containing protein [Thermoproteota archaeon]
MSQDEVLTGDLLICKVKELTDFGIILENENLTDKEIFLHVSEISRERSIQDFNIGEVIVVRVLKISRNGERIFVSLKQIDRAEARSLIRRWKAEKKALEIFKEVAAKYAMSDEILEDTRKKLVDKYGSVTEALRIAVMEGENTLARTKLSIEAREAVYELAAKELIRNKMVKKMLVRLYFIDKYGLNKLKNIFEEVEKMSTKEVTIETRVVAAPRYSIALYSYEPKKLNKVAEEVLTKIKEEAWKNGGVLKILQ